MNREEATVAVAQDILADPLWAARVVMAALIAETMVSRDHPAFAVLNWATTHRPPFDKEVIHHERLRGKRSPGAE